MSDIQDLQSTESPRETAKKEGQSIESSQTVVKIWTTGKWELKKPRSVGMTAG